MLNSAYGRICGVEVTDEGSSHSGLGCDGGFKCDREQCRREAGERDDNLVIRLLRALSSALSLTVSANHSCQTNV